ncbi:MAG: UDP-2,4-diacetamido-2,4,6-trideoxy-beta-L-altropyranose hydrolase [Lachnospiraceae bacterium]|nr:UDP-2,4-diacetamido-2,4,6-trideoxy-beta-L-altropyranose hydrolase [Lachnospiraceae bacterium]
MRYYFRADGNAATGAGHLMRCLTIADELQNVPGTESADICFLCADETSGALAEAGGYRTLVLHTDYRNMEAELPQLAELFSREASARRPVLVVDSYHVTDSYLKALGSQARIFLLDDMAQQAYAADCVLNYNAFATQARYRQLYQGTRVRFYTGSAYVPLRPQFRGAGYSFREQVQNVLITTGGGDQENIAARIFHRIQRPGLRYHAVIGRYHPDFEGWQRRARECPQLCVHHDVKDMASLMGGCDIAVTAGGTTVYELCAVGVPFLCFSYAENQESLTEYIGQEGIAGYCGAFHRDPAGTLSNMERLMDTLTGDARMRRRIRERERNLADGLGAVRIARLLSEL